MEKYHCGTFDRKNRTFSGQIQINNVPIQEIKESSLMDKITLVRHNSYLFKGTVEENLKMADPSVSREQMEAALRQVNLYEFLQMQNGLDTMLEEQGSNFSGGQRQRLAIARALLHDTPMYILMRQRPILMWKVRIRSWK